MLSHVSSAAVFGIHGYPIAVEVDLRPGLPSFTIVGLPDAAVRESRERVGAALKNSGFDMPLQRITVNLAPADIKKEGPSFDLAIALGILGAAGAIEGAARDTAFLGELGLDGALRPVRGVLPAVMGLRESGFRSVLVPAGNAREAGLVDGVAIFAAETLAQTVQHVAGAATLSPVRIDRTTAFRASASHVVDLSEVRGQAAAKRALEMAAGGGHNVLLMGPPGSGKTLLARRLPTILPDLDFDEALETTKIHSVAGLVRAGGELVATRPFRSPHHQMSAPALVGGGTVPRPGEVSLAHRGVLFLDEFTEFDRASLEALRQPLEDRCVTVARAAGTVRYPADFLLVAAANPCPCGYAGSSVRACTCSAAQALRYRSRISGPLMDRIDLHVELDALKVDEIGVDLPPAEPSEPVRGRVMAARVLQRRRFQGEGITLNAQMGVRHLRRFCRLDGEARALLRQAVARLGLSARAHDRVLKVARTAADLADSDAIRPVDIAEAVGYRFLDRSIGGG